MLNEMHKEAQIRSKKLQITRKDSSKPMPIAEVEKSSNKLNIGAMLEAIYNQIYQEESSIDGSSGRSTSVTSLNEYNQLNEINVEQFQLSAKAFVDQKFSDRKLISEEWESSELRPFSDALEILKPKLRTTKYSENVSCHCSLIHSHGRSSSEATNVKSTPFSFSEMKRKLKCSFGQTKKEASRTLVDVPTFAHTVSSSSKLNDKTRGLKSNSLEVSFAKKRECDVIVEAKRHLSARLEALNASETSTSKKCPKKLGRILSSPEHDSWLYNLGSQMQKGKKKAYASPSRESEEATMSSDDFIKHDRTIESSNADIEVLEMIGFATVDLKPRLVSRCAPNDDPSTPLSTYQPVDSTKDREEQPSPVSVLEPCFTDDVNSPPSIIHRRAGQQLQPRRLDYEESSHEASPVDPTITTTTCIGEKDSISCYVTAVLQASRLNWDELSAIILRTNQLLHGSLFGEVELPSTNSPYDPKLLFDHINEVLLDVHQRHFGLPPWLLSVNKQKIQFVSLEQHVVDEVLKESNFYLIPRTERRTLDQLIGKDVRRSGWWLDIRLHVEEIASQISEYLLDELILYLMIDFDS